MTLFAQPGLISKTGREYIDRSQQQTELLPACQVHIPSPSSCSPNSALPASQSPQKGGAGRWGVLPGHRHSEGSELAWVTQGGQGYLRHCPSRVAPSGPG